MSKEVKRWSHHTTWEGLQITATMMALRGEGEYVSWDDYDALLAELDRMAEALVSMTCAYRMAIQAGHARITALGGDCDSVERMLADFPDYGKAVELYKSHRAALQGEQP